MAWREPLRSRVLLGAWLAAVFGASAVADLRVLAAGLALAGVALRRGAARAARRVGRVVLPATVLLAAASWAWLRLATGRPPAVAPFVALALRTTLLAFLTFSLLERIALFRALAPFPTLCRLLVIALAQIHALRLLATESLQGLRSRLPRRPGTVDVLRSAGAVTATLFTLSMRNAREVTDAMRSRGF